MNESTRTSSPSAAPVRGVPTLSVILVLIASGLCVLVSLAMPDHPPLVRTDSVASWLYFGQRILASTLLAVALLGAGLVLGLFFPAVANVLQRWLFRSTSRRFLTTCIVIGILSSAMFAAFVMDRMPHIPDELAAVFQAKILSTFRLWVDPPPADVFFDYEHLVVDDGKWYGKYFLFQSLPLVPGIWLGVPWLIHPLLAGVAIWLTYEGCRLLTDERLARLATILMVISPFRVTLFGLMLSHASCMVFLMMFGVGVLKVIRDPQRFGWAITAGLGLGMAGNSRPLTAVAMTSVMGVAGLIAMPWRRVPWRTLAGFLVPLAGLTVLFFAYNAALTGDPLTPPFNKWSATDRLGFGPDVGLEYWRDEDKGHSLRKGLFKDAYFNLEALGENLVGWGYVTLVLLPAALIVSTRPLRTWMIAAIPGMLIFVHVFHVTHSVMARQARYWSEAMPMMILLVVITLAAMRRGLPAFCRWIDLRPAVRTGRSGLWLAGLALTLLTVPAAHRRVIEECRHNFWEQGPMIRQLAAAEHLDNALVFIKTGYYRMMFKSAVLDQYPSAFMLNDPDLTGSVIYARDRGDARNRQLIKHFPGRDCYRINMQNYLERDTLNPEAYEDVVEELELQPLDYATPASRPATSGPRP